MASIRVATPADARDMARLRWEWRAAEGRAVEMEDVEFAERFGAWLAAHAASHRGFVAEASATVVGTAWLAIIDRVPGPDRWHRRSGIVQAVYVTPDERAHGVGAALVSALIDDAHREHLDYLTVHPSELSFPLYRRLGFEPFAGVLELDVALTRKAPNDLGRHGSPD